MIRGGDDATVSKRLLDFFMVEPPLAPTACTDALEAIRARIPADAGEQVAREAERLHAFQDARYALLYLERIARFTRLPAFSPALVAALARTLGRQMRIDDLVALVLADSPTPEAAPTPTDTAVPATPATLYALADLATLLPPEPAAQALSLLGYLRLERRAFTFATLRTGAVHRLLQRQRPLLILLRKASQRYAREHAIIERWLHMIERSHARLPQATAEIVASGVWLDDHGPLREEKISRWSLMIDALVKPAIEGRMTIPDLPDVMRELQADSGSLADFARHVEGLRRKYAREDGAHAH